MRPNSKLSIITVLSFVLLSLSFGSCNKSDSYTITVEAYTKDGDGNYIATGNELIFYSDQECQTWSRTAAGDTQHSMDSHLHYNAAANVSYDNETTTFHWTEYGPEIDQESIDATCSAGVDGINKSVNNTTYYQDKPDLYLKITNVVEN